MTYDHQRQSERRLTTGNRNVACDELRPPDKQVAYLAKMYEANPPFPQFRKGRSAGTFTDEMRQRRSESAKRRWARKGAA